MKMPSLKSQVSTINAKSNQEKLAKFLRGEYSFPKVSDLSDKIKRGAIFANSKKEYKQFMLDSVELFKASKELAEVEANKLLVSMYKICITEKDVKDVDAKA